MILGVTGGIATGKSTVSKMFMSKGGYLIDADAISKDVVKPGSKGLHLIVQAFGENVLNSEGHLNRKRLGDIIFGDKQEKEKLDKILHPFIREKLFKETKEALSEHTVVLWDIPLLIEREMTGFVDATILVYVPQFMQRERLITLRGYAREDADKRIASQMDIEEKKKYADFVVDNQESLEFTQRQVDRIWPHLIEKT